MNEQLTILCGDALEKLRELPNCSVQCCVTSPPYWGLRDYGVAGQLGLEKTPQEYVAKLVEIFREVRRVLREDGTLWLNLGDSYAGSMGNGNQPQTRVNLTAENFTAFENVTKNVAGLKPKDLVGIPWRVAFALQSDGWWLRSDIIWAKPNPMPESVTDRPTKSHEYIFLITKSARYFYDAEAIKETATGYDGRKDTMMKGSPKYANGLVPGQSAQTVAAHGHERWKTRKHDGTDHGGNGTGFQDHSGYDKLENPYVRNKRSVWTVPTSPYREAHFATFPPDLIKPCILAGTKLDDVVIDPFAGSFTTCMVAIELGRQAIGIELNTKYVELGKQRCNVTPGLAL